MNTKILFFIQMIIFFIFGGARGWFVAIPNIVNDTGFHNTENVRTPDQRNIIQLL